MSEHITAPWTDDQVAGLNAWQAAGWVLAFTCGRCRDHDVEQAELEGTPPSPDPHNLVATTDGWVCPTCDYTQDWAHARMAEGPPANPLAVPLPEPADLSARAKAGELRKLVTIHLDQHDPDQHPVIRAILAAVTDVAESAALGSGLFSEAIDEDQAEVTVFIIDQ